MRLKPKQYFFLHTIENIPQRPTHVSYYNLNQSIMRSFVYERDTCLQLSNGSVYVSTMFLSEKQTRVLDFFY